VVGLALWSGAHRRVVIGGWIALLLVGVALSRGVGNSFYNSITLPGTDSQRATDLLHRALPVDGGDVDQIVFRSSAASLTGSATRARLTKTLDEIARLPHVTGVASPFTSRGQISRDTHTAYATVRFDERGDALPTDAVKNVIAVAKTAATPDLEVELGGNAIEQTQRPTLGAATAVGIGAAIVVLLVSFGSLVAMGLPILMALFGLGTASGLIAVLTHVLHTPDFAQELAFMIGLGVGVDYALLIVTRFREAYRSGSGDAAAALEVALATAGRSVAFAGGTVVIALLGLFAVGIQILYGVAIATSLAVILMLLASLTFLPAMLMSFGPRIGRGKKRRRQSGHYWERWIAMIQARPVGAATASLALLLVLAAPILGLRLAFSDAGNDRPSTTTRKAYDILTSTFGPGVNGPLQIAAALPANAGRATLARIDNAVSATPGVASVSAPMTSGDGRTVVIAAIPTTAPESKQTYSLVHRLRGAVLPAVEKTTGAQLFVGGITASQVDTAHAFSAKLPLFIAVVVALSALLLLILFRSTLIPLQAALMNLLSIGASLGVVQAVFERGWLKGLIGAQQAPIEAFIPVIVFAIVFGLSMDYEVFLVSRVHEEWRRSGDATAAVRAGIGRTGGVITAAAAVMIVVFSSFAASSDHILKLFGLALATAVFLDAFVIRSVLLPAVLQLTGKAAWHFPGWLDRRLPHVSIEPPDGGPLPTPIPLRDPA
jgi:RND superfamily putative drug exporter